MVSGITTISSRTVIFQPAQLNGLLIFSPAPISEMMTMNSVAFSIRTGDSTGCGENWPSGV